MKLSLRTLLFAIFIVVTLLPSVAQPTFSITRPEHEVGNDIIEFPGFYLVCGQIKVGSDYFSYVVKLGKDGQVIADTVFDTGSRVMAIRKVHNDVALFRLSSAVDSLAGRIVYTRLDTSLRFVYQKILRMPVDTFSPGGMDVRLRSDSTFFLACDLFEGPDAYPESTMLFYSISMDGDSISSRYMPGNAHPLKSCRGVEEKFNMNCTFVSWIEPDVFGSYVVTDYFLTVYDTIIIDGEYWESFSPVLVSGPAFILLTRKFDDHRIFLVKIDEEGHVLNTRVFGDPNLQGLPALFNATARNGDNVYFLGLKNLSFANPWQGNGDPSTMIAGCVDHDMNLKWVRYLGGDNYYVPYNIQSTSDGGCVLVGTFNDTVTLDLTSNIFVIKLDSNGGTSFLSEINPLAMLVKAYPNPTNGYLNLEVPVQAEAISGIQVFDLAGKLVLEESVGAQRVRLDLSQISSGTYLVKGMLHSGGSFTRKVAVWH